MSFDSWLFIISFLATILAGLTLLLKLPKFWVSLSDPIDVVKSLGVFLICICALMYSLNVLEPVSNKIKNNIIEAIEKHSEPTNSQISEKNSESLDIEKIQKLIKVLENYSRSHFAKLYDDHPPQE